MNVAINVAMRPLLLTIAGRRAPCLAMHEYTKACRRHLNITYQRGPHSAQPPWTLKAAEVPTPSNGYLQDPKVLYLRIKAARIRDIPLDPLSGIRKLRHDDTLAKVPVRLRSDLLEVCNSVDNSLELVTDCLEAYIAGSQHTCSQPRAQYATDQASCKALYWYLSSDLEHVDDNAHQVPRFLRCVAFLAVGGHAEKDLLEYCMTPSSPSAEDTPDADRLKYQRRGDALRWLLEAHTYWSTEPDRLQRPLLELLHVARHHRNTRLGRFTSAGNWMFQSLLTDARHGVLDGAYMQFVPLIKLWKGSCPMELKFHQAFLLLVRPHSPDLQPAFEWVRGLLALDENDEFTRSLLQATEHKFRRTLYPFVVLLVQELLRKGREADAALVVEICSRYPIFYTRVPPTRNGESLLTGGIQPHDAQRIRMWRDLR